MSSFDALSDIALSLRKEFTEVLRDRRTLLLMVALPVIVCPLLSLIPPFIALQVSEQASTRRTVVCLTGPQCGMLIPYFKSSPKIRLIERPADGTIGNLIISGACDVLIETQPEFADNLRAQRPAPIKIVDNAFGPYLFDEENVINVLNAFADDLRAKRLAIYRVPKSSQTRIEFDIASSESSQQRSAYWTGIVCTLLLMLTMTLSSMYPALDVITGERERGTLVLLLMAPGQRKNLVLAKLITVTTITFVAALLSLISACLSLAILAPRASDLTGSFTLSLPVMNLILSSIYLFPLAVSIAAGSILISSYARTFQQGQSYFTPIMLLSMVLVSMALAFDETAPFFVYFLPLTNLLLCMHKAIQGQWILSQITATLFSSSVYIALLLRITTGILDREESLFGIKQPPGKKSSYSKDAFVLYASCLAAFFYLSSPLQSANFLWGLLAAQILTIAAPALLVPKLLKISVKETLSLNAAKPLFLLAGVCLVPGLALGTTLIAQMQTSIMPDSQNYIKSLQELIIPKGKQPWLAYLTIAVGPGICEELLFRGAIQGLLRKSFSKPLLVITVGLLFGILHGSSARFLPTSLMGIALAIITACSGSIFPAILMHCCNNALAVYETTHPFEMTPLLTALSVASTLLGFALFCCESIKSQKQSHRNKVTETLPTGD